MIISIVVLSTAVIAMSVGLVFAYRQGLKDRQAIDKGENLKPIVKSRPREKTATELEQEKERQAFEEDLKAWRGE